MRQLDTPLLALTMGDPAGIGPEVVVRALRHAAVYERCRPLIVGDQRILARAAVDRTAGTAHHGRG